MYNDIAAFVYGNTYGKGVGLINSLKKEDSIPVYEQLMTLIIPNHGAYGGRNFGANNEKDLYDPLFGKDKNDSSKVEYASYLHDKELIDANSHDKQGDAHLNWVSNAWTGEGKEPGITGQVYRVAGTVAFGTVGLLQKYVLSSLFD